MTSEDLKNSIWKYCIEQLQQQVREILTNLKGFNQNQNFSC